MTHWTGYKTAKESAFMVEKMIEEREHDLDFY